MKSTFTTLAIVLCATSSQAEIENEIPVMFQFSGGLRSEYIYRGIHYSNVTQDIQLRADIDFGDTSTFSAQAWGLVEVDDDFNEFGVSIEYTKALDNLTYIFSTGYRGIDHSKYDSGWDCTFGLSYEWDENQIAQGEVVYSDAGSGWYGNLEYVYLNSLGSDSTLVSKLGVSGYGDYFGLDGFGDFYGSMHYSWSISQAIVITPYAGFSLPDEGKDRVYGGLLFEARF